MKYVQGSLHSHFLDSSPSLQVTCRYTGSLVGRDFKVVAQITPFILLPCVEDKEPIWLALSKVHYTAKTSFFSLCNITWVF